MPRDPGAQDLAGALAGDGESDVDRAVRDLPVTDLHVDRVDEDDRVDRVERPVLPLGHPFKDGIGDIRYLLTGQSGVIDLGQVCLHVHHSKFADHYTPT